MLSLHVGVMWYSNNVLEVNDKGNSAPPERNERV